MAKPTAAQSAKIRTIHTIISKAHEELMGNDLGSVDFIREARQALTDAMNTVGGLVEKR